MENEELNRKLTNWAKTKEHFTDEEGCPHRKVVQFTESLDVCFKWLVPKLDKLDISKNTRLSINSDCPNRIQVCVMIDKSYHNKSGLLIRNEIWGNAADENPALALCLAIEKLIDEGGDKNVET